MLKIFLFHSFSFEHTILGKILECFQILNHYAAFFTIINTSFIIYYILFFEIN